MGGTVMTAQEPRPEVPVLEARDVTVRFGGLVAVNGVSLAVPPGEVVGLLGPNGAGKSVLFSVLSGLRAPNAGRVLIDGQAVTKAGPQRRAALGMARTFQHPELFSGLTVREHVTLAYRIARTPKRLWSDLFTGSGFRRAPATERERVDDVLDSLGLAQIQHRPASGLPLGLARRVELARSLAREPRVLLLDEASSGLDAAETEELASVLRQTVRGGVSLLIVEHDVDLVLDLAGRVYVLDFGTLIAAGPPAEIRKDPKVRAAYLGAQADPEADGDPAAKEAIA